MNTSKNLLVFLILAISATACTLPEMEKQKYRYLETELGQIGQRIQQYESVFEQTLANSPGGNLLTDAVNEERLDEQFKAALQLFNQANEYAAQAKAIVQANKASDAEKLSGLIAQTKKTAFTAQQAAYDQYQRLSYLDTLARYAPAIAQQATQEAGDILSRYRASGARLQTLKDQYPEKIDTLQSDLQKGAAILPKLDEANDQLTTYIQSWQQNQSKDLLELESRLKLLQEATQALQSATGDVIQQLEELQSSYTKILKAVKLEYFAQVGRTSWNESSDFNTDRDYVYNMVPIDSATYTYLAGWGANALANSSSILCRQDVWDRLQVSPRENWPSSSHNRAEYWIEDLPLKYYHQYLVEENGKFQTSEWQEVDEEFFEEHLDDIGMAVESKPYGAFADETITQATPPGLAQVGNPAYGRWQAQGEEQVWQFLPAFAVFTRTLNTNHTYTQTEHQNWQTNYLAKDESYYGGTEAQPAYGTWGTESDSTNTQQRRNRHYYRSYFFYTRGFSGSGRYRGDSDGSGGLRGAGSRYRGRGAGGGGK